MGHLLTRMVDDSTYFTVGLLGFAVAGTTLVLGFALGEVFEIVLIGAIILLICPLIMAMPALRD